MYLYELENVRTDAGRFRHLLVRDTEFESSDVVIVIHGWFTDGEHLESLFVRA